MANRNRSTIVEDGEGGGGEEEGGGFQKKV